MLRTWIEGLGECVNYCVAENSLGSTRKRTWNADYTCFQFEFDSGVAFVSINHLPINLLDDVLLVEAHQADYMSKFSPIE
jgi:hypothetical protein